MSLIIFLVLPNNDYNSNNSSNYLKKLLIDYLDNKIIKSNKIIIFMKSNYYFIVLYNLF